MKNWKKSKDEKKPTPPSPKKEEILDTPPRYMPEKK